MNKVAILLERQKYIMKDKFSFKLTNKAFRVDGDGEVIFKAEKISEDTYKIDFVWKDKNETTDYLVHKVNDYIKNGVWEIIE